MSDNKNPGEVEEPAATKTILLVEDDQDISDFLMLAIAQETPYHTLLVTDGPQALNVVRKVKPDLILLDYELPGMNGLQLYDQLHATKELEDIPTIMISARLPKKELDKRKIIGMKKPFELEKLLDAIIKALA